MSREKDKPPYPTIWDELKAGRVVLFLGSGVSFGHELAHCLADKIEFPSDVPYDRDDLAQVASYCVAKRNRLKLLSLCKEVAQPNCQVEQVYDILADLVNHIDKPLLIITTNYDNLLESALKKPFYLVYPTDSKDWANSALWWKSDEEDQPKYYPLNQSPPWLEEKVTIIYKMYGSVNPPTEKCINCVITEEDHVKLLSRMIEQSAIPRPVSFRLCQSPHLLFLGYGMCHWNLRVLPKYLKTKPDPLKDSPEFNLGNVRTFLTEGFSDRQLRIIYFDEPDFSQVCKNLAQGAGKDVIIKELIEYAEQQKLLPTLLEWAKKKNPNRYETHQPYYNNITLITRAGSEDQGCSWAIQDQPSKLEQTFWKAHGVELHDMKIHDFVAKMQEQMVLRNEKPISDRKGISGVVYDPD